MHLLLSAVDCSGRPLKHLLLGAVDFASRPLKHLLLIAVDLLPHALEPSLLGHVHAPDVEEGLPHDDLPPDDVGQPRPPPPPDEGWARGKGIFLVFPSVPGPRRSGERAMMTSTLVPIFAAALLWRHLHSTPEAVKSADGLPVGHDTRPVLCLFPSQDQDFKLEHSVTSSSQDILCQ